MPATATRTSAPSTAPIPVLDKVRAERGLRSAMKGLLTAETKATQARQAVAEAIVAMYVADNDISGKKSRQQINTLRDEMFAVTKDTSPFEAEAMQKAKETFRKASQYHVRRLLDDTFTAEELEAAGYKYDSRLPVDQKLAHLKPSDTKDEAETPANQSGKGVPQLKSFADDVVAHLTRKDAIALSDDVRSILGAMIGAPVPEDLDLATRARAFVAMERAMSQLRLHWAVTPEAHKAARGRAAQEQAKADAEKAEEVNAEG